MLLIVNKLKDISFPELMRVYEEGNLEKAREEYPDEPLYYALEQEEREFYQYLQECFFAVTGGFYYIWEEQGRYCSALRVEPFQDGVLISALETAPSLRCRGYAQKLLCHVLPLLPGKVYSHVHKQNAVSLRVHEKCGFCRISEFSRYLDGSVNSKCCTMCFESRV